MSVFDDTQTLAGLAFALENNITISVVCPYQNGPVLQLWLCAPYLKLKEACSLQNVLHIHQKSLPSAIAGKNFPEWEASILRFLRTRYHQLRCHFYLLEHGNMLYETELNAIRQCEPVLELNIPRCALRVFGEFDRLRTNPALRQGASPSMIVTELVRGETSVVPLLVYQYIKRNPVIGASQCNHAYIYIYRRGPISKL